MSTSRIDLGLPLAVIELLGVMVGMIIAWWKEGLGALLALGSLTAFYLIYGYLMRNHIGGWAFLAFASPALLFLAHWLLRSAGSKPAFRNI